MDFLDKHWEVGSEFHWMGVPQGPFLTWPEPYRMFTSGRAALLSVWRVLQNDNINSLFVPDYFCHEVVSWWEQQGVMIRRYVDGPHMTSPMWESLAASQGDGVLAVNYFGMRDGNIWEEWINTNKGIVLIEDHSHDPLSGWAYHSQADYAFASLRKTFPVPDGAILWSPKGLPLPDELLKGDWSGSALKLAAMVIKKDYLEGAGEQLKDTFREFQGKGESMFGETETSVVSPWSRFLLASGYPVAWREQREKNVKILLALISTHPSVQPLFNEWPDNHCPFNVVLLFTSNDARNQCRSRLISAGVYPSVHWELNCPAPAEALTLSCRIMTIPVDQRYGEEDMKRIASILLKRSDNDLTQSHPSYRPINLEEGAATLWRL